MLFFKFEICTITGLASKRKYCVATCKDKINFLNQVPVYARVNRCLTTGTLVYSCKPIDTLVCSEKPLCTHRYLCILTVNCPQQILIRQLDSMLLCVCSQMTSKYGGGGGGHEAQLSVSLMFLQHFEVFCDLFLYRPTGTLNRFVLYDTKKQNHSRW